MRTQRDICHNGFDGLSVPFANRTTCRSRVRALHGVVGVNMGRKSEMSVNLGHVF